jgi:hypothetical protein
LKVQAEKKALNVTSLSKMILTEWLDKHVR